MKIKRERARFLAYCRYSTWHSDDIIFLQRKIGTSWSNYRITSNGYDPSLTCEYQNGANNYLYVSYNRWSGDLSNLDLLVARSTDDGVNWQEKVARGATDTDVHGTPAITNAYNWIS